MDEHDGDTGPATVRLDGWQNLATGLGTQRDKLNYWEYVRDQILTPEGASELYEGDDIAEKICSALPLEALKNGYQLQIPGDDDGTLAEYLANKADELELFSAVTAADIDGRATGGAVIWMGVDDGLALDRPLDESRIRAVRFLETFDRTEVSIVTRYDDPTKPTYNEPETVRLQVGSGTVVIHATRLCFFGGARTSRRERRNNGGWDHSVLRRCYGAMSRFHSNEASVSHLMTDASAGVMKMDGFINLIASNQRDMVLARLRAVDMFRSVCRSTVIDSKESFERVATSFAGIPEVIDRSMQRLAAASNMPMTILFGMSPGGLNSTGESDSTHWYDQVEKHQKHVLLPRLKRLYSVLMLDKTGPNKGFLPDKWSIVFPPLWQESSQEQADTRLKAAQADAIYIDKGVLDPAEVATSRFGGEAWSLETQIVRQARQGALDMLANEEIEESGAPVDISAESQESFVTVNEARAAKGLTPWPNDAEGAMTVSEFISRDTTTNVPAPVSQTQDPTIELPPQV